MDEKIKTLPGAPWDENHIVQLLTRDDYDRVIANGHEYTTEEKISTARARDALNGRNT